MSNISISKLFQENKLPNVDRQLTKDDTYSIRPMLKEDPAYPLLPGLLKEYDHCSIDSEVMFDTKLRSVRNQIECASGSFNAMWRILNRPIDLGIEFLPSIISSCFILHNYCETVKAPVNQDAIQKECEDAIAKKSFSHHLEKHRFCSIYNRFLKLCLNSLTLYLIRLYPTFIFLFKSNISLKNSSFFSRNFTWYSCNTLLPKIFSWDQSSHHLWYIFIHLYEVRLHIFAIEFFLNLLII